MIKDYVMSSEATEVVRLWRATATVANFPAYERHLRKKVLPELQRIAGFLGITFLCRDRGNRAELQVLTRWKSMDAIRQFAGDDPELAVVEPEAKALLLEFDTRVTHFNVVFALAATRAASNDSF